MDSNLSTLIGAFLLGQISFSDLPVQGKIFVRRLWAALRGRVRRM